MANFQEEESNPLLPNQEKQPNQENQDANIPPPPPPPAAAAAEKSLKQETPEAVSTGWTADGLPIMMSSNWDTGLCACLGRTDHFFSSDLEVCMFSLHFVLKDSIFIQFT